MPLLKISMYSSRQLQAVVTALKQVDGDVRKQIRVETKAMVDPEWRKAVAEHATTRLEQRVLAATARTAVRDGNVLLKSAAVGRPLRGGLQPKRDYFAVEFGTPNRDRFNRYDAISRKGHRFSVKRRTARQLRGRNTSGHVVYPAAADIIPRLASLWVQTAVRALHEAFEARG